MFILIYATLINLCVFVFLGKKTDGKSNAIKKFEDKGNLFLSLHLCVTNQMWCMWLMCLRWQSYTHYVLTYARNVLSLCMFVVFR